LTLVVQAAVLDGLQFDASPFGQDGFATTKVDVSRYEVNLLSTKLAAGQSGSIWRRSLPNLGGALGYRAPLLLL